MSTIDEPAPSHDEIGVQRPDQVASNISPTDVNTSATSTIDSSAWWDLEMGVQPPGQVVNDIASTSNMITSAMSATDSSVSWDEEMGVQPLGQTVDHSDSTRSVLSNYELRDRYFKKCVPLRHAAMKGNWREAEKIILQDSTLWSDPITESQETLLHIAAGAGRSEFVSKLLKRPEINYESLKKLDEKHRTPFVNAVAAGAKEIVELMLNYNQTGRNRNTELLTIRGLDNETAPLYYAALFGRGELTEFLYDMPEARESLSPQDKEHLFFACMDAGLYGVALKLLEENRQLATTRHSRGCSTALHILARNPSAFCSHTTKFNICLFSKSKPATNVLSLAEFLWDVMQMDDNKYNLIRQPTHILFDVVKSGNFQLLQMLVTSDPSLVWEINHENHTIFHAAVKCRRTDIFYLIYEMGQVNNVINSYEDRERNNVLHLAAILPPQNLLNVIPGAALQMRQELLWYKEVKKIMDPEFRNKPNDNGQTPEELFLDQHEALRKDGEKWMNNRAQSCSIVATLIATVVFATAFTVPGGNDQASGLAMFLKKKGPTQNQLLFDIFAISAAIALGASTISIIIFLSIPTSSFSYEEFLRSQPRKLMMGLFTLLISMIGMMSTFCIAFILAYAESAKLIPWIIIGIQVLPIVSFVVLQGRLIFMVFRSTYFSKLLFPPREVIL